MTGYSSTPAAATDESTPSWLTDLLKTAFGAALALTWAVFGIWLSMRRARRPNPLDEPAADTPITNHPPRTPDDTRRAPTCERMYDETRLVPQYLRSIEFPALKQDLLRLAREHTDEGQALRRLECIPDRRHSSLSPFRQHGARVGIHRPARGSVTTTPPAPGSKSAEK